MFLNVHFAISFRSHSTTWVFCRDVTWSATVWDCTLQSRFQKFQKQFISLKHNYWKYSIWTFWKGIQLCARWIRSHPLYLNISLSEFFSKVAFIFCKNVLSQFLFICGGSTKKNKINLIGNHKLLTGHQCNYQCFVDVALRRQWTSSSRPRRGRRLTSPYFINRKYKIA